QDRLNRWIGEVPASRAQGKQEENAKAQKDNKSETTDDESDRSTRRGVRSPMVGEVFVFVSNKTPLPSVRERTPLRAERSLSLSLVSLSLSLQAFVEVTVPPPQHTSNGRVSALPSCPCGVADVLCTSGCLTPERGARCAAPRTAGH